MGTCLQTSRKHETVDIKREESKQLLRMDKDTEKSNKKIIQHHIITDFDTFSMIFNVLFYTLFDGLLDICLDDIIKCSYNYLPPREILMFCYHREHEQEYISRRSYESDIGWTDTSITATLSIFDNFGNIYSVNADLKKQQNLKLLDLNAIFADINMSLIKKCMNKQYVMNNMALMSSGVLTLTEILMELQINLHQECVTDFPKHHYYGDDWKITHDYCIIHNGKTIAERQGRKLKRYDKQNWDKDTIYLNTLLKFLTVIGYKHEVKFGQGEFRIYNKTNTLKYIKYSRFSRESKEAKSQLTFDKM
eukprot:221776_1